MEIDQRFFSVYPIHQSSMYVTICFIVLEELPRRRVRTGTYRWWYWAVTPRILTRPHTTARRGTLQHLCRLNSGISGAYSANISLRWNSEWNTLPEKKSWMFGIVMGQRLRGNCHLGTQDTWVHETDGFNSCSWE